MVLIAAVLMDTLWILMLHWKTLIVLISMNVQQLIHHVVIIASVTTPMEDLHAAVNSDINWMQVEVALILTSVPTNIVPSSQPISPT